MKTTTPLGFERFLSAAEQKTANNSTSKSKIQDRRLISASQWVNLLPRKKCELI
jgi:hypothetical protein